MLRLALASGCIVLATGCASLNNVPISSQASDDLREQTVAPTTRKVPDFAAMTAGKAAFALIGALAMISEGNKIIADNKIPDPANSIAAGLASALQGSHGVRVAAAPVQADADDPARIAAAAGESVRFVLDVQTINWSFGYFPTDWTHYRVIYVAKARLIDSQSKAVVAEGFCRHVPESNTGAPTHDELLGNGAALLKSQLATVAGECVKTLKEGMLKV